MKYPFKNLVFEGGGVKGIAYVGALRVLKQKSILGQIQRVGGASAGAIIALLVGLGYTVAELRQILGTLNFKNFMDDSWGVIRDTDRLITHYGWYKGDFFRNWAAERVAEKAGNGEATFQELKKSGNFLDMYFMGTNLSTHFSEVFSFEHTPRMCVADAVRYSMSIPLFFAARRSARGDIYVDGGVLDNYPIKLFDRKKYQPEAAKIPQYYADHNKGLKKAGKTVSPYLYNMETLGFRLDTAEEIAMFRDQAEPPRHAITDFFDFAWALVKTIMDSQTNQHLHSDDWQRTIYINTLDVGTTDFDITDQKKQGLVKQGKLGAETYFKWYDDPKKKPANRPD